MVFLMAAIVRWLFGQADGLVARAVFAAMFSLRVAHHHPQADAERAVVGGLLDDVDGGEALAGVLERRDALLERWPARPARSAGAHRRRALRASCFAIHAASASSARSDAVSRSTPIGRPARSFRMSPPGGLFVARGDAGLLHRLRVHVGGVAAGVFEDHRVVRRHLAERVVEGEALDVRLRHRGPLLLVPAAAADPLARLRLRGRVADQAHDLAPSWWCP